MRHRTHTAAYVDVDGIEVELDMNPDWLDEFEIVKPTPTSLVVGYLMPDDYPAVNPMKDYDGNGTLYTLKEGVITDDNAAPAYLGLNDFCRSWRSNELDRDLELDGIPERVGDKIKALIKEDPELVAWFTASVMESGTSAEETLDDLLRHMGAWRYDYARLDWSEAADMIDRLGDYDRLAADAWDELYAEGKIGEYLAVPVRYHDSVHGPGTTQIYTTSIDDCNAVWVPGKNEIENMNFSECKSHADKMAVADKYATGVLEEYEKWCNGEVYGIVTETFVLTEDGERYEKVGDTDSCWGFIGQGWAEEALKENVTCAASQMKIEKEAA